MSMTSFEHAAHDLGIDLPKLQALAPAGAAAATPTATLTEAGTVLQAAAVPNAAAAPTKAEFDALLVALRASGALAV